MNFKANNVLEHPYRLLQQFQIKYRMTNKEALKIMSTANYLVLIAPNSFYFFRQLPKAFTVMPSCDHGERILFRCSKLSMQDVRRIHQTYYKESNAEMKKNFILRQQFVLYHNT